MADQILYKEAGIQTGIPGIQVRNKAASGSRARFLKLLASMFKIGLIGFGGGSALIPVIEEEVVEEQGLISKAEYDEDVVAACVTPGALPVEIAAGNGRRAYGLTGMVLAAVMIALPGALITVLALSALSESNAQVLRVVRGLSIGLGAFISTLLISYAVKTQNTAAKAGKRTSLLSGVIMIGVFLLTCGGNIFSMFGLDGTPVFGLSTIEVLMLAFFSIFYMGGEVNRKKIAVTVLVGVLFILSVGKADIFSSPVVKWAVFAAMALLSVYGIIKSVRRDNAEAPSNAARQVKPDWKAPLKEAGVWAAFLVVLSLPAVIASGEGLLYIGKGFLSSLLSFGGGDAYLSVADGMFVEPEMISRSRFYSTLVPIANALPGSILCKILSGVGYLIGIRAGRTAGYLTALAGFAVSVAASGMIFGVVCWLFRTFENITVFRQISKWIRPIISGLLLNVMLTMIRTNIETGALIGMGTLLVAAVTIGIAAVDLFLLLKKKTGNVTLMIFSAAIGMVLLLI